MIFMKKNMFIKRVILLGSLTVICAISSIAQQYADCSKAMEICKKQNYSIEKLSGEGRDRYEADFVQCFRTEDNLSGNAEQNSAWIRFKIAEPGWLTFTITPKVHFHDIDFVVYRLPKNKGCAGKQIVRCMASGDYSFKSPCMGKTGLRKGERESSEDAGCADRGDNAWLAPLRVVEEEEYVILVSNVSDAGAGFDISFGGTAKLPCDDEPEEKPIAEVTKPKKEEVAPVVPEPQVAQTPTSIGGREVEVGETVKVNERVLTVSIWDGQVVDGDVISIFLNDKKVVDHAMLTAKPKVYEIELPEGKEHFLTVYADDFGKAEPNTAMVKIFDGQNERTINLVAGRTKQESIKIVLD